MQESEKRPSERILSRTYDNATIGLCHLDTDLRYVHINKWLARLNGSPIENHLGRTVHEMIPEVAAGVEAQLRQVIETNEPIIEGLVEAETPSHPGVRRTFMHNYLPVAADDGSVIGVSCLVEDITARRKAEAEWNERTADLEKANRELQQALDSIEQSKGLVPICVHCKNIRGDKGFWQTLETYLSQHSEAKVSHGICPACVKTHYPEVYGAFARLRRK